MHISVYTSILYPKKKKVWYYRESIFQKIIPKKILRISNVLSALLVIWCFTSGKLFCFSVPELNWFTACLAFISFQKAVFYYIYWHREYQSNLSARSKVSVHTAIKMISKKICDAIKPLFLPSTVVRKVLQGYMTPHVSPSLTIRKEIYSLETLKFCQMAIICWYHL